MFPSHQRKVRLARRPKWHVLFGLFFAIVFVWLLYRLAAAQFDSMGADNSWRALRLGGSRPHHQNEIVAVILASQSTMDRVANLVGSLHRYGHGHLHTVVYGVNLKRQQRQEIRDWKHVDFVDVAFLDYNTDWTIEELLGLEDQASDQSQEGKGHRHSLGLSAKWYHLWSFVVTHHAIEHLHHNQVLFLDPSYQLVDSPDDLIRQLETNEYFFISEGGPSHPAEAPLTGAAAWCSSLVQGYRRDSEAHHRLLRPLAECALSRRCYEKLWKTRLDTPNKEFRLIDTGGEEPLTCSTGRELREAHLERIDSGNSTTQEFAQFILRRMTETQKPVPPTVSTKEPLPPQVVPDNEQQTPTPMPGTTPKPDEPLPPAKTSGKLDSDKTIIALLVPSVTSKLKAASFGDLPLFTILLKSIRGTHDANDPRFKVVLYLGYDKGDPMYDGEDKQVVSGRTCRAGTHGTCDIQAELKKQVLEYMNGYDFGYRSMRFEGYKGAPCWLWTDLGVQAAKDGADYLYQLNDDIEFLTPGWAPTLTSQLSNSPVFPNFGATGPLDIGNPRTMTQSFVHRTHIDIFGFYYPKSFKNWYSDDWITWIYRSKFTYRDHGVKVRNVNPQGSSRYNANLEARHFLTEELDKGCTTIEEWLQKNHADHASRFNCAQEHYWWDHGGRRRMLSVRGDATEDPVVYYRRRPLAADTPGRKLMTMVDNVPLAVPFGSAELAFAVDWGRLVVTMRSHSSDGPPMTTLGPKDFGFDSNRFVRFISLLTRQQKRLEVQA